MTSPAAAHIRLTLDPAPADLADWLTLVEALARSPSSSVLAADAVAGSGLRGDDAVLLQRMLGPGHASGASDASGASGASEASDASDASGASEASEASEASGASATSGASDASARLGFERRLASHLRALLESSPGSARQDFSDTVFVHAPCGVALADGEPVPAVPPRIATYARDCVRAAMSAHRARTGRADVGVLVLDDQPMERPFGEIVDAYGPLMDTLRWDRHARSMVLRSPEQAMRLAVMASCGAGGVLSPKGSGGRLETTAAGVDALGVWALRAAPHMHTLTLKLKHTHTHPVHGRGYAPAHQVAGRTNAPELVAWHGEGDLMAARPMVDAWRASPGGAELAAARRNLAGCPPIMWINLDRHDARRQHIETQLEAVRAPWHRRVRAVDGWDAAQMRRRVLRQHATGTPAENACTASHLLAMARFLHEFPEEPWAVVLEDDASLELAPRWRAPLRAYLERATAEHPGWRVMQLGAIVCDRDQLLGPTPVIARDRAVPRMMSNWFSTIGYAVTREAAQDYVRQYVRAPLDSSNGNNGRAAINSSLSASGGDAAAFDTDTISNLSCNDNKARSAVHENLAVDLGELVHDGCTSVHAEDMFYSRHDATLFAPLVSFIGSDSDINQCNPIPHSVGRSYLLRFWGLVDDDSPIDIATPSAPPSAPPPASVANVASPPAPEPLPWYLV